MCGRFTLNADQLLLEELFELTLPQELKLKPRYNITPTQEIAVVRTEKEERQLEFIRWGLIPSWAKDPSIGARMNNARSETAAEKPSFRTAFRRRRCLIPANGFYEWKKPNVARGKKQPFHIGMVDRKLFAMAGIWEAWRGPEGETLETCAILTTTPNELMEDIHDRMPVILTKGDYGAWLDPELQDVGRIQELMRPFSAGGMHAYPVGTVVNNARNDVAECIEEFEGDDLGLF